MQTSPYFSSASSYDPSFASRRSCSAVSAGVPPATRDSYRSSGSLRAPPLPPTYSSYSNYPREVIRAQGPNSAMAFQVIKNIANDAIVKRGLSGKYAFEDTYRLDSRVPDHFGCTIIFSGTPATLTIEQAFDTTPTEEGELPSTLYHGAIRAHYGRSGEPPVSATYTSETIHSVFEQFISGFISRIGQSIL